MKKAISFVLCLSLIAGCILAFASCGKPNNDNTTAAGTESGGEIAGGWARADSPVITDDFRKVFDKAVAEFDVDYTPVAYLASQVAAGMNHCVLCKAMLSSYAIVYVYEDPEGNAEVTGIVSSDAAAQSAAGGIVGGWTEPESPEMTDDAKKALEKACETLTGAAYTPVALLATQVVAGMNYRIICESRPAVPVPDCEYVIVTVYADLQGNAEITDTIEFRDKVYNNSYEWMCDDVVYKYRLEISGRMPNAAKDSTFVYLSNIEEISFEQAYMSAGISSSTEDYFSPEDAVLVEMK